MYSIFWLHLTGRLQECLNLSWFHSLEELNEEIQNWFQHYNFNRPHQSLGNISPYDFERTMLDV
ncbi:integrase core domain-containing protein [Saprospira grandis]|uniref:Integrase catalytic region n=1 Tax=Saprospira grandis (strain Lewin) TaxID=984262 RepID=H6L2Z6_SAPGL|nr:integrase core domain-containing protein [Saprospira grandis]AFC23723.1 integrase catalytic region [Saprospira grandis str. Lewin]